jgi:hypothetical protein
MRQNAISFLTFVAWLLLKIGVLAHSPSKWRLGPLALAI